MTNKIEIRISERTDFADGFPAGDFPLWLDPILIR